MKVRVRNSHRLLTILVILAVVMVLPVIAGGQERTELKIPDIPGYITLKCDFHMHTVFSDGAVWPDVRADEVWREGLDAFSITDHLEFRPREIGSSVDHNRSYELALPRAEALRLLFIRGAEITRGMPPGHYNAIFLEDANPLDNEDYKQAIEAAISQDAFVIWNHPGWRMPDTIPKWFPEHTELYEKGWIHGIEIVNNREYYPLAFKWCLEKKLTLIGNSDVHAPINQAYDFPGGERRPVTLVFAVEKSLDALKDALFERRTAVYWNKTLFGEEMYLKPLFEESIGILNPDIKLVGRRGTTLQIRNKSDIPFKLTRIEESEDLLSQELIMIPPDKTVIAGIRAQSGTSPGEKDVVLKYKVENMLITPEDGLPVEIKLRITFTPTGNN